MATNAGPSVEESYEHLPIQPVISLAATFSHQKQLARIFFRLVLGRINCGSREGKRQLPDWFRPGKGTANH